MTEMFGAGRFCSRSCANSKKHTEDTKKKISESIQCNNYSKQKSKISVEELYYQNPRYCEICGVMIEYRGPGFQGKTCSTTCAHKLQSKTMIETTRKKGLHRTVPKRYKYGTYKGVPCDSSWELAFLIYHLDNGSNIKRNKEAFEYELDGHKHLYYPDFIIDDVFYEIKNYYTNAVYAKINQFPKDKKLDIVDGKEISRYIKYCITKYGERFFELYDKDSPSWMTVR